jgi:two-component system phosphate regulon response regulator OmpR
MSLAFAPQPALAEALPFLRVGLPHLLLVAPAEPALEPLRAYLQQQGLRITSLHSVREMERRLSRLRPDLIVLDAALPGMAAFEACRRLRAEGERRGLVLLGAGADEVDRVLALEMGADDVLGRPFSPRELLARLRAVLRRASMEPAQAAASAQGMVSIGEHQFDLGARSLRRGDELRMLAAVEYALLAELVLHPHVPLSRERLAAASHPQQPQAVSSRAIDTAIVRLRRLLEPEPARPRYIHTVRGQGYMFAPGLPH